MLHDITTPIPWKNRLQVIEDVSEDEQPLKSVEVKRNTWKFHWPVDTPEQISEHCGNWRKHSRP